MKGSGRLKIVTPPSDSTDPASTMPASFAGAETSRTSSMMPVPKMIVAATTTAATLPEASNAARN